jgi:hypothetical protein
MIVVSPNVGGFENEVVDELILNTDIPLLIAGIVEVLVYGGKRAEIGLLGIKRADCRSG